MGTPCEVYCYCAFANEHLQDTHVISDIQSLSFIARDVVMRFATRRTATERYCYGYCES